MQAGNAPLRAAFIMEQVLGHVTHDLTLRSMLAHRDDFKALWIPVTYEGHGRLERAHLIPRAARATMRGALQVREGINALQPDVLFFHTQKPAVLQPDLLVRYPSVLSLDVTPRQYDELGVFYDHVPDGEGLASRVKHQMNRLAFQRARRIVVWSRWVLDSLIRDYEVPERKVDVIPPGVDLAAWGPVRPRVEDRLPRVLFVGGDFDRKGGELLLDWFHRQGRGLCELDIVTRTQVEELDDVRVHRAILPNSASARALFHDADIFVLPSLGECFGIAAIEAMAAGLPVIMTRVGGAADIVDSGENGLLIAPGDEVELSRALNALVTDPTLRRDMGRAGRAKAERAFNAAHNAERIVACLHRAVRRGAPHRAVAAASA